VRAESTDRLRFDILPTEPHAQGVVAEVDHPIQVPVLWDDTVETVATGTKPS
jgi:hypothetical protein